MGRTDGFAASPLEVRQAAGVKKRRLNIPHAEVKAPLPSNLKARLHCPVCLCRYFTQNQRDCDLLFSESIYSIAPAVPKPFLD